jgi:hypothetical protein
MCGIQHKYSTCLEALQANDVEELKRMREAGLEFVDINNDRIILEAIDHGNVAMIEYVHTEVVEFDSNSARHMALEHKLDMLQFLFSKGIKFDCPWTIARVAMHDNLEMVKFLYSEGCGWNEYFYMMATVKCTDYAFSQGLPINWTLFEKCIYVTCKPRAANSFNPIDTVQKFQWFLTHHSEPQKLMDLPHQFDADDLDAFDLDNMTWRNMMFTLDLKQIPALDERVREKKVHLEQTKELCRCLLTHHVPKDVIEYCLIPFW